MTTGWLILLLGVLLGVGFGLPIGRWWGYRDGHQDGYQDHRAETNDRKNAADLAAAASPLEVRAKTGPIIPDMHAPAPAVPYLPSMLPGKLGPPVYDVPRGSRPFPPASPRTHTSAADIGPVDTTDAADRMIDLPGGHFTDPMRALSDETENIILKIRAGVWP